MFAEGNFRAAMLIHDRVPPGVPVLQRLKSEVSYRFEEIESGGRVRIATKNKEALAAVYDFLRFQIVDHRTGDTEEITEAANQCLFRSCMQQARRRKTALERQMADRRSCASPGPMRRGLRIAPPVPDLPSRGGGGRLGMAKEPLAPPRPAKNSSWSPAARRRRMRAPAQPPPGPVLSATGQEDITV